MNPARTETNAQEGSVVDVKNIDCEFLPIIYEILKRVEKDPTDSSAKNKESLEVANRIQELNKKLEKAKEQVRNIRGVDLNPEEQKQQLAALKNQLALKKELIQKYKSFSTVNNFLEAHNPATATANSGSTAAAGASAINGAGANGASGAGGNQSINGGGQTSADAEI